MAPTRPSRLVPAFAVSILVVLLGASGRVLGIICVPFTDVAPGAFCPLVQEIFYLGITTGTTPTTYDPTSDGTRLQMAAFLSRTVDGVLNRGSRRAALNQFWTPGNRVSLGLTTLGSLPALIQSDGEDLWVANIGNDSVAKVHASNGKLLETWTGATSALGVIVAMGHIFVSGETSPGQLYRIDPSQAAGAVTTVASNLGNEPFGIAFDGSLIWTANISGSVSIVTPGGALPWTVTTISTGFGQPYGVLFDGSNVWVTDAPAGTILKLDASGAILQTVTIGPNPRFPIFDGTNIWVPNAGSNSVSVVRASNGTVLASLTGNGLNDPRSAAFDGQRVLVTNAVGHSISLWKAADLTSLGSVGTGPGTGPLGACSDGINFWITLNAAGEVVRF